MPVATLDDAMNETLANTLFRALLVLRITLGLFLLQWGVEKFVVPQSTSSIWGYYYGVDLPSILNYVFGVVEIGIAICLFLGLARTVSYGAAVVLHAVSVAVSWRELVDPWGEPINHLFIAGVPVLGAFVVLFLLRHWDRGILDAREPSAA